MGWVLLLAALVVLVSTCGGIAILDGSAGEGGSGTSSSRTTTTITTTNSVVASSSTGPSYECEQACGALYDCSLGVDPEGKLHCPGLTGDPGQKKDFIGYCVDTTIGCTTALQFVNPADCQATVAYFKSNNSAYVYQCNYGTEG